MAKLPSPHTTAQLILINARLYEQERTERRVERYRLSTNTMRRIAKRELLRRKFLRDLEESLAALGWLLVELSNEFAVISVSKSDSWIKLSSKRLSELLETPKEGIDELYDKLFPPIPDDDDEAQPA